MLAERMNLRPARERWAPQPGPQTEAICVTWCPQLLYGGAAGGGKSDYLLGDYLQDVPTYGQAWRGILFRRSYNELEELIARSLEIYPAEGAQWSVQKTTWTFPNGATLKLRYLEADRDALRYQGHQYTWIGWDELGQWASDWSYRYMRARLRSAERVPTKRIRCSANPGGVGHHWIKAYFIEPAPLGYEPLLDSEAGMDRMFIPSRIQDNQILLSADPGYIGRLRGLGSPELVKAWLEGNWDVIVGAYFPEFSIERHVIEPFTIPGHWTRFRSMDWGSARPFSIGWWAVSDGTGIQRSGAQNDLWFPAGGLIKYREWYGVIKTDTSRGYKPNVGLKLPAEEVAKGIVEREANDIDPDTKRSLIRYGVLDPAAFAEDGGPSIAERMRRSGASFRHADNARVGQRGAMGGWDQLRSRLVGIDGHPMIYFFSTCTHTIRTLPALQHDEARPEDVDTDGEDHAADETRYACMSRPMTRVAPVIERPKHEWEARDGRIVSTVSIRQLIDAKRRRREMDQ